MANLVDHGQHGGPGDAVDVDAFAGRTGGVIRIVAETGEQIPIASGGFFIDPLDLVIDDSGAILVSDFTADAIIRVDPLTGAQQLVMGGPQLDHVAGIALDQAGDLIVSRAAPSVTIARLDPLTAGFSVITVGGSLVNPQHVAIDAGGDILVANGSVPGGGGVVRVDPVSGNQTVVTQGGLFWNPLGVAVDADGDIIVSDWSSNRLVRVDPITGAQSQIAAGGLLVDPVGLTIVPAPNQLPVADAGPDLLAEVGGMQLPAGTEEALSSTLGTTSSLLDKGRDKAAVNNLRALKNKVEAQAGKRISTEDADNLVGVIDRIISSI